GAVERGGCRAATTSSSGRRRSRSRRSRKQDELPCPSSRPRMIWPEKFRPTSRPQFFQSALFAERPGSFYRPTCRSERAPQGVEPGLVNPSRMLPAQIGVIRAFEIDDAQHQRGAGRHELACFPEELLRRPQILQHAADMDDVDLSAGEK